MEAGGREHGDRASTCICDSAGFFGQALVVLREERLTLARAAAPVLALSQRCLGGRGVLHLQDGMARCVTQSARCTFVIMRQRAEPTCSGRLSLLKLTISRFTIFRCLLLSNTRCQTRLTTTPWQDESPAERGNERGSGAQKFEL